MQDLASADERATIDYSRENARIYRDNVGLIARLSFIAIAAFALVKFKIWPVYIVVIWYLIYATFDVLNSFYLGKSSVKFVFGTEAEKLRIGARLAVLTIVPSWMISLPLYWVPGSGLLPSLAAIMFCCAVIMLFCAHHAIGGFLIALTLPPMAGALLYNLYRLAPDHTQSFALTLGVMYVLHSLVVHYDARSIFHELMKSKNAAENANQIKNGFLSRISHEIRTPLNGIIGLSQAILLTSRPTDDRENVQGILSSGKEVQKIVDALIEFVEYDAKESVISTAPVDLAQLIESVINQYDEICQNKPVHILNNAANISYPFRIDEGKIKVIIQNLVSNAVKFTNSGSIEIKAEPIAGGVKIEVADTGIGLRPDELEKVFLPFYKGRNLPKNCVAGVGLGLSIVEKNVQILGGKISVESRLNSGTRFSVQIPGEFDRDQIEQRSSASANENSNAEDVFNILIAEDNPTNRLILKSILSYTDAECTFVENGLLAVQEFQTNQFSLVLMDINMPVMDGIEATKRIREIEKTRYGQRAQIVAVTADVLSHQISQHRASGFDGHIQKPIQASEIFALLHDEALYHHSKAVFNSVPTP